MPPKKKHQLKVNDLVLCWCRDLDRYEKARILEFRDDGNSVYVHFVNQDKRLDDCISVLQIKKIDDDEDDQSEEYPRKRQRRKSRGDDADDECDDERLNRFEETHREITKIRNIDAITLGKNTIRTWYYSPYPQPYHKMSHLYICEYCMKYFATEKHLQEHHRIARECTPPGREIYRDEKISVYEMSGKKQKLPCQCLCLLGKLFLDHKTLFYDVEGFNFYVLCECDQQGAHIAGFFSKEVACEDDNILSCIVVLPPYQNCGYGSFLISLSYEISRRSCKLGSPEHPLSDLGKVAFHSYWKRAIAVAFGKHGWLASLDDIMKATWISKNDIIEVMKELGLARFVMGEWQLDMDEDDQKQWAQEITNRQEKARFNSQLLIWLPNEDQYL